VLRPVTVPRLPVALPPSVVAPVALALAADDLLAAQPDGTIVHLRVEDRAAAEVGRWGSSRPVGALALSPSGTHALTAAPGSGAIELRDLRRGAVTLEFGDGRHPVAACFVEADGRELLACSRRRFMLELLDPAEGGELAAADLSTRVAFEWSHLVPVAHGRALIAPGHSLSEGKNSLLVLSTDELLADPEHAAAVAGSRAPFSDYAWRLAAGPCGGDAVAVFRDPEDDEEPDGEEPADELEGFCGVYVRDLATGRMLDRVAADLPVETGSPLLATGGLVAAVTGHGLTLLSRDGAGKPVALPARATALDPVRGRAAVYSPDRGLELVALG
jgi:hypothetical protein